MGMKGVVLAGGSAKRLGELTRITNKHLLPLADFPMIYYPLKALEQAGVTDVCLITGKEHAEHFIALLGDGKVTDREGNQIFNLDITYRMQARPGGISEAISLAENFINKEKFVVFLGDNIIEGNIADAVQNFSKQFHGARILLKEIENPNAYGVPVFNESKEIICIEEKPLVPKSHFAVIGIYMLDYRAFDFIRGLKPSERGELEITDLLNLYMKDSKVEADILQGWWRDAGQSPKELYEISQLIYQTGVNKVHL